MRTRAGVTTPRGEVPYNPSSTVEWGMATRDEARFERRGEEWLLVSTCAACGHTISRLFAHGLAVAEAPAPEGKTLAPETPVAKASETGAPTKTIQLVVACNCGYPHEGQPELGSGCGAFGLFDVAVADEQGSSRIRSQGVR